MRKSREAIVEDRFMQRASLPSYCPFGSQHGASPSLKTNTFFSIRKGRSSNHADWITP
ncbi:hypothetical protein BGZ93_003006, partial [Podila epicladia]